ncbi:MAG: SpoIVB peptidase [Christensenellales bacterium]
MKKPLNKRIAGWALAAFLLIINQSGYVRSIAGIPDTVRLSENDQATLRLPFGISMKDDESAAVLFSEDGALADEQGAYTLNTAQVGRSSAQLTLFGFIPIKEVAVEVLPQNEVVAGGQALGIALFTNGALVVGGSDIITADGTRSNPARDAGIVSGDVITHINGQPVRNADHVTQILNSIGSEEVQLQILREGEALTLNVKPVADAKDGRYRLGIWVRDSTAGIGTLSFYDAKQRAYGALGHGIVDVDTHQYLTVRQGEVSQIHVDGVIRGTPGTPGELYSEKIITDNPLGDIQVNNEYGIYGRTYHAPVQSTPSSMPVGLQSTVRLGKASILSTVGGRGTKAYDCEILRITPQGEPAQKSMIIRVTDPELLEITGGIVQGMSGSPIVQDGKIIGAVTHVFVNDPTRGYGVFIEWMLQQTMQVQ